MITNKALRRYIDRCIANALNNRLRNRYKDDSFTEKSISVIGRLIKSTIHAINRNERDNPDSGLFSKWKLNDLKEALKELGKAYALIKKGDDAKYQLRMASILLGTPESYDRRSERFGSEAKNVVGNATKAYELLEKLKKALRVYG